MKADRYGYQPLAGPRSVAVHLREAVACGPGSRSRSASPNWAGHPVIMDAQTTHFGRGETLSDAARVLSRYVAAIVMRTFGDDRLAQLAAGGHGAGGQRADRRLPPVPAAGRPADHPRARSAVRPGATLAYLGDSGQQHGPLVPAGRGDGRHARPGGRAGRVRTRIPASWRAAGRIAAKTGGSVAVAARTRSPR